MPGQVCKRNLPESLPQNNSRRLAACRRGDPRAGDGSLSVVLQRPAKNSQMGRRKLVIDFWRAFVYNEIAF